MLSNCRPQKHVQHNKGLGLSGNRLIPFRKARLLFSAAFAILSFLSIQAAGQPNMELRGVWIATLDNIDWPSRGNYDTEAQKAEFIRLLDMHQHNGMNAVIVQIRPATDAFYASPFEPWSEWLTGRQGKPPSPYYDPLQFMVSETHKRGMEFHAWCNPYRAEFNLGRSSISPVHITRLKPSWFITYGNKRYFDPGNKEVQTYLVGVITDVVKRYDIDAIQFDDYFYPQTLPGRPFPDQNSYARYGNGQNKEDWRRSNVDSIILKLNTAIKKEKPFCKFGISPFGVWRNKSRDPDGSDTRGGLTNYDDLFADILLWLEKGWIDYVTPQLYWELGHRYVAYEILLDWWSTHAYGRHLYIGHSIYRAYDPTASRWRNPNEIPSQIKMLREYPEVHGSMYFSSRSFLRNPLGWNDSLRLNYYKYPALVPPMKWIDSTKPPSPIIERQMDNTWKLSTSAPLKGFVVYCPPADTSMALSERTILQILPALDGKAVFYASAAEADGLAITALSRTNMQSDSIVISSKEALR